MEQPQLETKDVTYYDKEGYLHSVTYEYVHGIKPTPQFKDQNRVIDFWNKLTSQIVVPKGLLND